MLRKTMLVVLGLALLATAGPTEATTWCGENGVIRFSFVPGDSLVTVYDAGEPVSGVTRVTVHCWLDEVDPVAHDGEAFLNVGAFELGLLIEGAEAFIVKQEIPNEGIDVGRKQGSIAVGLFPARRIEDGRLLLAVWDLMFQGRPEDVRIGLDPEGPFSCTKVDDCPVGETRCLYVGDQDSGQNFFFFGAACEPAWLNPTGGPDQTREHGPRSWKDVGVYEAREVATKP